MRITLFKLSTLLLLPLLFACGEDNKLGKDEGKVQYAPDLYWESSYSGKMGLQLETLPSKGEPRMYLAGVPIYCTGMNCYNLFVQSFELDNMGTDMIERTVKELAANECPIVRFSCSPFYAHQMHFYTDQKAKYLANLDRLASLCDEYHVLLIPSVFWNTSCVPGYFSDELSTWGDTNSNTYKFMIEYTKDIVNTLKGHKCLAAWEFGNEFNLAADIPGGEYPFISAQQIETAFKGFAETVASLDTEGRIITTGNSIMRNAQYHMNTEGSWSNDSYEQYVKITGIMTPDPMEAVSEHIYEEARVFSDLGTLNRTYQIQRAKQAAASLGKAYYVGEFTGPVSANMDSVKVKNHFSTYLAQKVQISLLWSYSLMGTIEYSFAANTKAGEMAFGMMRRYNRSFKEMNPE